MLSHKSTCYSSSIMFLLNLAYQKKFSSFSSVSITSLLPCHRVQSDVCGTSFYTLPVLTTDSHVPEKKSSLPTNNPYLFTPLSGAQLVEEKITTHWWSGVFLHITNGSSYRTETSQKLFWNDCAVLPSMSAGLLLQNISLSASSKIALRSLMHLSNTCT